MVSIIVPIYKAEKYLHRCIDSILAQSYADFELLLINDGSPDSCGAICDKYATKDSRIRVFHKENGGVSSARNLGLENAFGEWITFIDADDYVHPRFLESLYAKHRGDFVVGSFQLVGSKEKWNGIIEDSYYDKTSLRKKIIDISLAIHFYTPWAKLYSKNIIDNNHLRFDERMRSGEDWLFVLNYLNHIQSIQTCSSPYYYYERGNVDGLSQNSRYFEEYFYAMDAFYEITSAMEQTYGECVKIIYLNSLAGFCMRQCQYLYNSEESIFSKFKKLRHMYMDKHLIKLFNDTLIVWRKKIRLFHFMMYKGYLMIAFSYLYILKGKIYS